MLRKFSYLFKFVFPHICKTIGANKLNKRKCVRDPVSGSKWRHNAQIYYVAEKTWSDSCACASLLSASWYPCSYDWITQSMVYHHKGEREVRKNQTKWDFERTIRIISKSAKHSSPQKNLPRRRLDIKVKLCKGFRALCNHASNPHESINLRTKFNNDIYLEYFLDS